MAATPSPHSREGEWIVADIGGTHARFGYWRAAGGLDAGRAARYRNDDFADIAALIDRYRRDHAPDARQALLALALPVGPGPLRMTNRDWVFSAAELRATLGLSQLLLVNDFVAAYAGTGSLLPHEVERIGGAARPHEPWRSPSQASRRPRHRRMGHGCVARHVTRWPRRRLRSTVLGRARTRVSATRRRDGCSARRKARTRTRRLREDAPCPGARCRRGPTR
jgi:hypothetical protein